MTISATSATPDAPPGVEVCRVTVSGPVRRADFAVPVTAMVGELLPHLIRRTADEPGPDQSAWVLQRLGEPPLDPGASVESLDLRDGEVLYLNPEEHELPEFDFDDISVGVAHVVGTRADRWRPGFSRALMLGLAGLALAVFAVGADGLHPGWLPAFCYTFTAVGLAGAAVLAGRVADERACGVFCGLAACVFVALAGLAGIAARHEASALFTVDRRALLICGACVALMAGALPAAGRLPIGPFGAVCGTALAAGVGGNLALATGWDAADVAATLAVAVFVTTTVSLKLVLRLVRLRVALLPHTAEELQEDVDPVPEALVTRRTGNAVAILDSLFIAGSLLSLTAVVLLIRTPGWVGWTLGATLSTALLLRTRELTMVWQRAPMSVCAAAGLAAVAATRLSHLSPGWHVLALLVLALAATWLVVGSRRLPGSRILPIWGHLADILDIWTSLALVPLLLQLIHLYSSFRSLIG
jgi:type VII secretion integral membrane protein EccD